MKRQVPMTHEEIAEESQHRLLDTEQSYALVFLNDPDKGIADVFAAAGIDEMEILINSLILYRDSLIEVQEERARLN
jgi:hypothetical protein